MVRKLLFLFIGVVICNVSFAQLVTVQADYNSIGDCVFSATNNAKVPMYLHLNIADLENTTFNETLPYIKRLTLGYNNLFTLQRDLDADVPRFNYEIKTFRSNPTADVDLDFPYLIPFEEKKTVQFFDVKNIDGFWGTEGLDSWYAVGFHTDPGSSVLACRNGIVTEIVGKVRTGDSRNWYHTWTNCITLLHPDGTLICYHGIACDPEKIAVGDKVFAGQNIGEMLPGSNELVVLIFHDSLYTKILSFIIPQFVLSPDGKHDILNSTVPYQVYHPDAVVGMEMTKKEKRKYLGKQ
ncbi:hypothetical protein SLH46_10770 [Draconibacterium sp. IB214405]|uniref:hypothetical protein n=1 Tax=Draconibacterium sp. IB214405 TaxID=3097352 RepID=UPI002A172EB1|nr:hypothetical protein [Draconibacterium sp. IB214405]MDX8339668.1 hypothetical protein [Draconibacterium sp. IB214405]